MSTLKVNAIEKKDADQTLTVKDATLTGATVADMSNFTFPTGHIIQTIVATHSTATSALTETSFSASGSIGITGSITPKSTSNKIL